MEGEEEGMGIWRHVGVPARREMAAGMVRLEGEGEANRRGVEANPSKKGS